MKAEAADYPFGRDPDVIAEKSLQCSLAQPYLGAQFVHPVEGSIGPDPLDNPAHDTNRLIRRRHTGPQELLSHMHHPGIALRTQHGCLRGFGIQLVDTRQGESPIRNSRNRPAEDTTKPAGAEAHSQHPTGPLQPVLERSPHHPEDRCPPGIKHQVHARVGQRLLRVRLLPTQIPRNNPEVLNEGFQVRCRLITRKPESLRSEDGVQYALGLRRDLLSEIFKALTRTRAMVWLTGLSVRSFVRLYSRRLR